MIYKYEIDGRIIDEPQSIKMPVDHVILNAQFQKTPWSTKIVIWAEVDPESPPIDQGFYIAFTGSRVPDRELCRYVSTLQRDGYVFHIYTALGRNR